MRRHVVMVLIGDLPRLLQPILLEPLRRAPDIDLIQPDAVRSAVDLEKADVVILSRDRYRSLAPSLGFARLVLVVSMDGQGATAYRAGQDPLDIERFGHQEVLPLIRASAVGPVHEQAGFWRRFWGGRAAGTARPGASDQPVAATDRRSAALPGERSPIVAECARLAARILDHRHETAPQQGPGRSLIEAATRMASAAGLRSDGTETCLPGLARLTKLFDLTADERDMLALATLVEVDPGAARLVALLNDHLAMTRPTPALSADLGGDPGRLVMGLLQNGPLVSRALILIEGDGPMATRSLRAHPDILPVVLGYPDTPPFPVMPVDGSAITVLALADDLRAEIVRIGDRLRSGRPGAAVAVIGDEGVGRRQIAEVLAATLRHHALIVPGTALANAQALAVVRREGTLRAAAIVIENPEQADPDQLSALIGLPGEAVFLICRPETIGPILRRVRRPVIEVAAPRRDLEQRIRLWSALGPQGLTVEEARDIATRFDFGRDLIGPAVEMATRRKGASPGLPDLKTACETLRDIRFAGTAERLPCPFEPDEIVLAPDTQAELDLVTAWARDGAQLFATGGPGAALRAGGGLACLFSGPPGVGKTMAAQIIARQVDYALYRIDLSQVTDKFIGESEKRLATLFDEAERSRVALFFDEADALFGKRTQVRDSHDRYANITVDYLLQRIEAFDGFAILATNLAGNIDEAFLRRVRVRAEFAPPGPQDRRRIWTRLLPPPEERSADIDVTVLADPFDLVGGEIRNALYTAHLLASRTGQPLAMAHCVRGLWREIRKIGRVTDMAHLGAWRQVIEG